MSAAPAASILERMDPLILDIGVPLPGVEGALGPQPTAAVSGEYRHQWRNYFREEIFPRLMTFQPDMIFISAGFDAHKKDTLNGGYVALVEEDFEWVTANLLKIANSCCEGRVVSALEGGYQLGGEYCSSFAKSVKTHVSTLVRGAKTLEAQYSQADADREKAIEREILDEQERKRVAKEEQQRSEFLERIARQRQLQEEAEEELAQLPVMATATASVADAEASTAADGDADGAASGRKRRRAKEVDYVALNEELKKSNAV